jgi:WD40 repeat protein
MRKLFTLFFITLICGVAYSQNISVASFRCLENDINARTSKVIDINGELCALIIINTTEQGFEFSGCNVEKTEQKTGEIWVFVSPGVKFITIKHRELGTIRNYPFPQSIKSGITYEMKLKTEPKQPTLDSASMMKAMEQKLLELEQKLSQNNQQQKNNIPNFQHLKTFYGYSESVRSVAYSPDGSRIAFGSANKTIDIWDANKGLYLKTLKGHTGNVTSLSFSPDGSRIVSGSTDACLKIWNANTGVCIKNIEGVIDNSGGNWLKNFEGHLSPISSVAYSPDGKYIVSGSYDGIIKIWDANTGQCLKTLEGHSECVSSVAYSPDGTKIISGSDDKSIKIWDANTRQCLQTLEGHKHSVLSVAYSPDGKNIVSGSYDNTVKIWGEE